MEIMIEAKSSSFELALDFDLRHTCVSYCDYSECTVKLKMLCNQQCNLTKSSHLRSISFVGNFEYVAKSLQLKFVAFKRA